VVRTLLLARRRVLLWQVQAGVGAEQLQSLAVAGTGGLDLAVERAEADPLVAALDPNVPLARLLLRLMDAGVAGTCALVLHADLVPRVLLPGAYPQVGPAVVQTVAGVL